MNFFIQLIEVSLTQLYSYLGSWGFSIIVFAFLVRVLLYPIQIFNFNQRKQMQSIQPQIDDLTRLLKSEPLKLYTEINKLKKDNGVKSGWSLISSLIPLPILFSIYKVFSSLQALTTSSFAWMVTLGAPDPFFILPAIVAITTYIQAKGNTYEANTYQANKTSSQVMKLLPILSFAFMTTMPAGLVGYYAISGLVQCLGDYGLRKL